MGREGGCDAGRKGRGEEKGEVKRERVLQDFSLYTHARTLCIVQLRLSVGEGRERSCTTTMTCTSSTSVRTSSHVMSHDHLLQCHTHVQLCHMTKLYSNVAVL